MKKILSTVALGSALYLLPIVTFAQKDPGNFSNVTSFGANIVKFINGTVVPLIFAIAFLVFIWGIFKYFIFGGSEEEKRKEGRQLMMYAIIGFVLMASVWGIVNLVSGGLSLQNKDLDTGTLPRAPTP